MDIGLAVLRRRGLAADGRPEYELVEYLKRTLADDASGEMILEGGFVYRLVPLCFGLMQEPAPRRAVLVVHSAEAVKVEKDQSSWPDIGRAVFEAARKHARRRPVQGAPGLSSYLLHEHAGKAFAVENVGDSSCFLNVDASESVGVISSRDDPERHGVLSVMAAIPPHSRQVLLAVGWDRTAPRFGAAIQAEALPGHFAEAATPSEGLHASLPLLPEALRRSRPEPDRKILEAAPPERRVEKRAAPGSSFSVESAPEDEDLKAALALSMECATPAPSVSGTDPAEKARVAALVKRKFEELVRSGVPRAEAAVQAMKQVKQAGPAVTHL